MSLWSSCNAPIWVVKGPTNARQTDHGGGWDLKWIRYHFDSRCKQVQDHWITVDLFLMFNLALLQQIRDYPRNRKGKEMKGHLTDVYGSQKRPSQRWRWLGPHPDQCWWWRQEISLWPNGCFPLSIHGFHLQNCCEPWNCEDDALGLTGVSRKAMDFGIVVGHVQCTDILIFYILYALYLCILCYYSLLVLSIPKLFLAGPSCCMNVAWTLLKTESVFECEECLDQDMPVKPD